MTLCRTLSGTARALLMILLMVVASQRQAAFAAESGSPAKGLTLARNVCADCHAVELGATHSPVERATPFQVFAETAGLNRTALLVFLRTPHPTMPNLVVTGVDADNLIAYMLSLKTKP